MDNIFFWKEALKEAKKAFSRNEVPVGAIIVKNNKIISRGYNQKEKKNDVLAHAEIIAIKKANKIINDWRLEGCSIYVTLEPCPMCLSAIKQSRIEKIFYILEMPHENKKNFVFDTKKIFKEKNESLEKDVKNIMQSFFKCHRGK